MAKTAEEYIEGILVLRSARKTVSLQIKKDLTPLVRAPFGMPKGDIAAFIKKQQGWLEKHTRQLKERAAATATPYTKEELMCLAQQTMTGVHYLLSVFAPRIGVSYGKVGVGRQTSRWGSCTGKGNLRFNCLLAACPPEVMEYVVIHELCHRRHMNHSPAFWSEVERHCPSYKIRRKWLKNEGLALINRLACSK